MEYYIDAEKDEHDLEHTTVVMYTQHAQCPVFNPQHWPFLPKDEHGLYLQHNNITMISKTIMTGKMAQ